jgi:hypothetical protein
VKRLRHGLTLVIVAIGLLGAGACGEGGAKIEEGEVPTNAPKSSMDAIKIPGAAETKGAPKKGGYRPGSIPPPPPAK